MKAQLAISHSERQTPRAASDDLWKYRIYDWQELSTLRALKVELEAKLKCSRAPPSVKCYADRL